MFSHVCVGVTDFSRALSFYRGLANILGLKERFCDLEHSWAAWQLDSGGRPLFLITTPHDSKPHRPGNGQMTAFLADVRSKVDRAHDFALRHGGTCEGPPGLRPHYHEHYYGAYFRDTEGNKLCVACHHP